MIPYLQLVIFTTYIVYISITIGVQKSISETWYKLNNNWLFGLFCFSLGLLQCCNGGIYFFLSGGCLCFVAGAAGFKDSILSNRIHYVCALFIIILALVGLSKLGYYFTVVPILLIFTLRNKIKNVIWWIEVVAFYSIILTLIYHGH